MTAVVSETSTVIVSEQWHGDISDNDAMTVMARDNDSNVTNDSDKMTQSDICSDKSSTVSQVLVF